MSWIHRQVNAAPEHPYKRSACTPYAFTAMSAAKHTLHQEQLPTVLANLLPIRGDRMQCWHRHRYRKRARAISDQAMEAYLRDDVPCGFPTCGLCNSKLPHLPESAKHVVIPDAHTLETYLEVFQLPEIHSVVYMTSVVRQVQPTVKLPGHCSSLHHLQR